MLPRTFQGDLEAILNSKIPIALARFGDGEYAVLHRRAYYSADSWSSGKNPWITSRLRQALTASLSGYIVGIASPCCMLKETPFYVREAKEPTTFATIFSHYNRTRTQEVFRSWDAVKVSSKANADFSLPANGVDDYWNLDKLVTNLLRVDKPILISGGPAACVVVHELWKRGSRRHAVLDVGAIFDPLRPVYEQMQNHECSWGRRSARKNTKVFPPSKISLQRARAKARFRR